MPSLPKLPLSFLRESLKLGVTIILICVVKGSSIICNSITGQDRKMIFLLFLLAFPWSSSAELSHESPAQDEKSMIPENLQLHSNFKYNNFSAINVPLSV